MLYVVYIMPTEHGMFQIMMSTEKLSNNEQWQSQSIRKLLFGIHFCFTNVKNCLIKIKTA